MFWSLYCNKVTTIALANASVQSLSHIQLFVTLWSAAFQASLSFTISQSLLKLMSIESVLLSNHLILYCLLLLFPSVLPSIRVFSSELSLHIKWPKYWSFSVSPSNEYSGLISLRADWFDLHAVQGTLKSLLQHFCCHFDKLHNIFTSSIFDLKKPLSLLTHKKQLVIH